MRSTSLSPAAILPLGNIATLLHLFIDTEDRLVSLKRLTQAITLQDATAIWDIRASNILSTKAPNVYGLTPREVFIPFPTSHFATTVKQVGVYFHDYRP